MPTIRYYQIFTLSQSQIGKLGVLSLTRQDSQHDFYGAGLRLGHGCISCLECFGQKGSLGFGRLDGLRANFVWLALWRKRRVLRFFAFTVSKNYPFHVTLALQLSIAGAGSSWQDFALREVGLKLRWFLNFELWSPVQGTSLCHFRFFNVTV